MSAPDILGQGAEFRALLGRARELVMPHGLLITGPSGCGKSDAARQFAMALLCDAEVLPVGESEPPRACGVCGACIKTVTGNHPDLHVVEPPEEKKVIPVDAVRAIREKLDLRPVEGRARVVILDPGDALNESGQNALLKTLEEPGDATFLLLTASRPERLLPTVRSRVTSLRLLPLRDAEVAARCGEFPGLDEDRLARAVAFAQGSVGVAKRLVELDLGAIEDVLDRVRGGAVSPGEAAAAALDGAAEGKAGAEAHAGLVFQVARAACRSGFAAGSMVSSLAHNRSDDYGSSPDPWIEAAEAVLAAEQDLHLEISAHHALTEMFLRWSQAFGGRAPR